MCTVGSHRVPVAAWQRSLSTGGKIQCVAIEALTVVVKGMGLTLFKGYLSLDPFWIQMCISTAAVSLYLLRPYNIHSALGAEQTE